MQRFALPVNRYGAFALCGAANGADGFGSFRVRLDQSFAYVKKSLPPFFRRLFRAAVISYDQVDRLAGPPKDISFNID